MPADARDELQLKIPEGWDCVPLDSLVDEARGISYGIVQPGQHVDDGIPVVRVNNLRSGRILTNDVLRVGANIEANYSRTRLRGGEVLLSLVGTLGECAVVPNELAGWNVARAVAVVPPKANIDPYWVAMCLRSADVQALMRAWATTTVQATLNLRDVRRLPILYPPERDISNITRAIRQIDDKIDQNRQTGQLLEKLAQATFKAWFVDFDPVKAKTAGATSFPGMPPEAFAALPNRFVDCPLGQVPEGWEVTTLEGATTTIETGKRPKGGVGGYSSGVPSIGAESITRIGEYDFGKTKYVPEAFFEAMKKGVLSDGDVLLYKDGGRPGDFQPHVSMVGRGFPFDRMCINEHVFRIRARSPLTQSYLYLWLSSEPTMEEMRRRGTGVAIPGLSAVAAKQIATLVPTESVVNAFENIAEPLLSLCLQQAAESSKLAALRDYLLPRLLSGRIRVHQSEAEAKV